MHPHDLKLKVQSMLSTHSIDAMEREIQIPNSRVKINHAIEQMQREEKHNKECAAEYLNSGRLHQYHKDLKEFFKQTTNPNDQARIQQEIDFFTNFLYA